MILSPTCLMSRTVQGGYCDTHEVYDVKRDRWASLAPLNLAQSYAMCAAVDITGIALCARNQASLSLRYRWSEQEKMKDRIFTLVGIHVAGSEVYLPMELVMMVVDWLLG